AKRRSRIPPRADAVTGTIGIVSLSQNENSLVTAVVPAAIGTDWDALVLNCYRTKKFKSDFSEMECKLWE
ncbi:MAG: hypothetical protein ACPG4T_25005, partial [Nannocystaceae bacterium]